MDNEFPLPLKRNDDYELIGELSSVDKYEELFSQARLAMSTAAQLEAKAFIEEKIGVNVDSEFFDVNDEAVALSKIIVEAVTLLEWCGYDAEKRQELYRRLNESNRKEGEIKNAYFGTGRKCV